MLWLNKNQWEMKFRKIRHAYSIAWIGTAKKPLTIKSTTAYAS